MSLDIGLLMAGAKERGELEARVTGLISEVKKAGLERETSDRRPSNSCSPVSPFFASFRRRHLTGTLKTAGDVILFIDEVHTLIGSGTVGRGNKGSNLDIGNLLKPALGRGELQVNPPPPPPSHY